MPSDKIGMGQGLATHALTEGPADGTATGPVRKPAGGTERRARTAERLQRRVMLVSVFVPFAGFLIALATWQMTMGPLALALLGFMYALSILGITVGYHRLFAHRAFKAKRAVQCTLAALGCMAAQGPVISWVANHRRHHRYSDKPGDPHSPHLHAGGWGATLRGFWHAHVGWTFKPQDIREWSRYAPDLLHDPAIFSIHRLYWLWVALGLIVPALIGGLLTWSWTGASQGFLWGGLVRLFLLQHVTFSINSISHTFGSRDFVTEDRSRNNLWLALISFGEGWHNNHHAFPNSPVLGLYWWQIDFGAWVIKALRFAGLASELRLPAQLGERGVLTAGARNTRKEGP